MNECFSPCNYNQNYDLQTNRILRTQSSRLSYLRSNYGQHNNEMSFQLKRWAAENLANGADRPIKTAKN